ncbi:3-deoxy-D-manno-octulosonic acid transferase, partial [Candidatus Omnitrophota bacterium]
HLERLRDIEKVIIQKGFQALRLSSMRDGSVFSTEGTTIFLLDVMGQLKSCYAQASAVFVGGSLVKKGGHNIIEPAVLSKPIVFGPFMYNFQDIADLFLQSEAAIQIADRRQLENSLSTLLHDEAIREMMGAKARGVTENNKGATERTLKLLQAAHTI